MPGQGDRRILPRAHAALEQNLEKMTKLAEEINNMLGPKQNSRFGSGRLRQP